MIPNALRWLGQNLGTLLLAFILSVVVWVSAVITSDPNEERIYPRSIPLEIIGQNSDLYLVDEIPTSVRVTLNAPQSKWPTLNNNPNRIEAWIDLSGFGPGEHEVPVRVRVDERPVRIVQTEPDTVVVRLEPLVSRQLPVTLSVDGEPSLGYRMGEPELNPDTVTVSGPESLVTRVDRVRVTIDLTGARDSRRVSVPVETLDANGDVIEGVNVTPRVVAVNQPVNLEGGYKNVVIKVVTTGQIASGYRLTNISVTPQIVTVFSADPSLVNELPGFVDTEAVDLTNLNDDIEIRKELDLPAGITLVGSESVLVQVSVAAIEGSLSVNGIPIDKLGLTPELQAEISPATIDIIVTGPLPVLDTLSPASFRAVVDLTSLGPGTYQLSPIVDLIPDDVIVESILPETVEVTIAEPPTPTPPVTSEPTPTVTVTPGASLP